MIERVSIRKDAVDATLRYLTDYAQLLAASNRVDDNVKSWEIQKTMSMLQGKEESA